MFYVSCMCGTLVREDKDTFFKHNSQHRNSVKKKKSPNAPWIQSNDLSLSCQLISMEGEERQLGLVYTWSLYVFFWIGNPSHLLLLAT